MKPIISEEMIVNDVIKQYPNSISIFSEYAIDACCGGALSIGNAAERHNIPLDQLLSSLNKVIEGERG